MREERIEGAATGLNGKLKGGLGRLTGDTKLQLEGKFDEVKGKALDAYGRAIDKLETLSDRAPADLREPVRTGLDFARRKPLVTTGIIAVLAFILAGSGRRRRY
ncbi:MAG: CsbD family protein [Caulobacteraceae bacterium]|nr:CsbD family protein [Caulobacteraceae bacterium]